MENTNMLPRRHAQHIQEKFSHFQCVKLSQDVNGFPTGSNGTIVEIHDSGAAYEVELFDGDGNTIGVITAKPSDIYPR